MRKKLLTIITCIFLSILSMYVFHRESNQVFSRKGDFARFFPPHFITSRKVFHIENIFQPIILGITREYIYIGTSTNPESFKEINYKTGDITSLELNVNKDQKIAWRALRIKINSQGIYLSEGITPSILYSDLKTLRPVRLPIDSVHFSQCLPLSPSSFVLKTYDAKLQQNILAKETLHPITVKRMPNILEKQVDGIFCTDGELHYNRKNNHLIYVYHYRNQFIGMDTDMNILYKGKTIDTVSHAKIKVTKIRAEGSDRFILAAPPLIVNKKSYADGNHLFIHSNFIAKNEEITDSRHKSVIDVYSLKNQRYIYSFYIPGYDGKQIRDFAVYDNALIALYDNDIIAFGIAI
ncbi:hypothetical protein SAMN02927921_04080 [Sinomicrobium oceani]|uniref:TolB-like 6-blade propeller-like n=1 Tax=Sinomicrobium oceani TaxID=1150368 RepID=A0A1K1RVI9_9FLAO|nr:hypothetical protein [Sinomicrobium oceani]SFW76168.1 hypothetical protein SAMN02927921_04080 [Sinomicrobium oceani]